MNDYRQLMRVLGSRWIVVLAGLLAGVYISAGWSIAQPLTYTATARIFIATPQWNDIIGRDTGTASGAAALIAKQTGGDSASSYGNQFTQQRMPSYLTLLTTPAVLGAAAAKLNSTEPELASRVTGRLVPETVMVDVTVSADTAQGAAHAANVTVEQYIDVIKHLESPTDVTDAASPVQPVVIAPAEPPRTASSPNVQLFVTAGAVLGLLAGIAAAVTVGARSPRHMAVSPRTRPGPSRSMGGR